VRVPFAAAGISAGAEPLRWRGAVFAAASISAGTVSLPLAFPLAFPLARSGAISVPQGVIRYCSLFVVRCRLRCGHTYMYIIDIL
jgi:hypothetical protein